MRLVDCELHRLVRVFVETERRQTGRKVRLVEDTHHHLFAVDGGQDRDADIDLLAERLHLEASILRTAAFGDVEVRENFDAGADGVVQRLGGRRTLHQFAIDAVAQARRLLHRLKVDIRGVRLQRFDHDGVHHADDGGFAGGVEGGVERFRIVLLARRHLNFAVVALHDVFHREGRVGGGLRLLETLDDLLELVARRDHRPHLTAAPSADLLLRRQVERIGERHREASGRLAERKRLHPAPSLVGHAAQEIVRGSEAQRQGNRLHAEVVCGGDRELDGIADLAQFLHASPLEAQAWLQLQMFLVLRHTKLPAIPVPCGRRGLAPDVQ